MPEHLNSLDLNTLTRIMRPNVEEWPELMIELGVTEGFLEGEATATLRKLERMAGEATATAEAVAA